MEEARDEVARCSGEHKGKKVNLGEKKERFGALIRNRVTRRRDGEVNSEGGANGDDERSLREGSRTCHLCICH